MNQSVFQFVFGFAHRNAPLDALGIFFASYLPYFLFVGFFFFLFGVFRGWRPRLFIFLEAVLAVLLSRGIVTYVIAYFYNHPRPFAVLGITPLLSGISTNSFPSGHMAFLFALAGTIFLFNRTWGYWYGTLAFLVGFARIFAGVHWPLDIVGGALIGVFSAFIIHRALRSYSRSVVPRGQEG